MRREVIETIREAFPFKSGQISDATPLQEFVRDAIDAVELIAVLSNKYGIRIDPAALDNVQTVADVIEYVERHAGDGGSKQSLETF